LLLQSVRFAPIQGGKLGAALGRLSRLAAGHFGATISDNEQPESQTSGQGSLFLARRLFVSGWRSID